MNHRKLIKKSLTQHIFARDEIGAMIQNSGPFQASKKKVHLRIRRWIASVATLFLITAVVLAVPVYRSFFSHKSILVDMNNMELMNQTLYYSDGEIKAYDLTANQAVPLPVSVDGLFKVIQNGVVYGKNDTLFFYDFHSQNTAQIGKAKKGYRLWNFSAVYNGQNCYFAMVCKQDVYNPQDDRNIIGEKTFNVVLSLDHKGNIRELYSETTEYSYLDSERSMGGDQGICLLDIQKDKLYFVDARIKNPVQNKAGEIIEKGYQYPIKALDISTCKIETIIRNSKSNSKEQIRMVEDKIYTVGTEYTSSIESASSNIKKVYCFSLDGRLLSESDEIVTDRRASYLSKSGEFCYTTEDGVFNYSLETKQIKQLCGTIDNIGAIIYENGHLCLNILSYHKNDIQIDEIRWYQSPTQYQVIYKVKD